MNEECEAVMVDRQVCAVRFFYVRRHRAPSSHVSNETYSEPNGREDPRRLVSTAVTWSVAEVPEEASGLRQPRFWIRVFLLLDRLPAKANP